MHLTYKALPTEMALGLHNVNLPASVTGALQTPKHMTLKYWQFIFSCYYVTHETIYQMQTIISVINKYYVSKWVGKLYSNFGNNGEIIISARENLHKHELVSKSLQSYKSAS